MEAVESAMILIGGRIFGIFLATRYVCAVIRANIGNRAGSNYVIVIDYSKIV